MQSIKNHSLEEVKKQIDDILSSELSGCRYAVYAHYNANGGGTLFSYCVNNKIIKIYINMQTVMLFAEHSEWEEKISINFCALYVAGYIKLLAEWESKDVFNKYRDGIIYSEVLYACFCNKKIKVFVPYICEILGRCIKRMRVLDVLCEANTLLRIKAVFVGCLEQEESTKIERVFDNRMLYLNAPEVIYVGKKTPSLSLKEVVKDIRTVSKKGVVAGLPDLPKRDDKRLIENIIQTYEERQDMFWIELLTHLLICSPNNIKSISDGDVLDKIYQIIEQYENYLIEDMEKYELSKNRIIADNLTIILKYIEHGQRLLLKTGVARTSKRTIHIKY